MKFNSLSEINKHPFNLYFVRSFNERSGKKKELASKKREKVVEEEHRCEPIGRATLATEPAKVQKANNIQTPEKIATFIVFGGRLIQKLGFYV